MITTTLTLTIVAMLSTQPRLTERTLADIAVIGIPTMVKDEMYKGVRDDQAGRLTFTFSTAYFWASFGSSTAYKHLLVVSLMAPDASEAEYKEYPTRFSMPYDARGKVTTSALGSGTLSVRHGIYTQNTLREPAFELVYVDRAKRLQIAWHAVKSEVDLVAATELIGRMAASFRIVRDPTAQFAEMRDRPRKEGEDRTRKRAMAIDLLTREGYGPAEPGKPVFKNGVYVEWMVDPEPRFQLLAPLGRVRAVSGAVPRPVRLDLAAGLRKDWSGSVGWREFADGEWTQSNRDNAYLPFKGITAALAAQDSNHELVSFYYSATVRVEEEADDSRLTSLKWFFDELPEIQRLWREAKLVTGGKPERD